MWELLTCGGDIHKWELLSCGGDIHKWELLGCGGDTRVGVTHVWMEHSDVGVTHMCGTSHQSEILHSLIFNEVIYDLIDVLIYFLGHSREEVEGHGSFSAGVKPLLGFHGPYGFRRNTPWLRNSPSPFGVYTRSPLY